MGTLLWNPQALCGWSEYVQQKKHTEALFKFVNLKAISLRIWPWGFIWIEGFGQSVKVGGQPLSQCFTDLCGLFPHAVTYTNVTVIFASSGQWEFSDQIRVCPPAVCVLSVTVPHLDSLQGKKERKEREAVWLFSRILTIPGVADMYGLLKCLFVCVTKSKR